MSQCGVRANAEWAAARKLFSQSVLKFYTAAVAAQLITSGTACPSH